MKIQFFLPWNFPHYSSILYYKWEERWCFPAFSEVCRFLLLFSLDKECSSVLLQTLVCGLCHFQLSGFEHCGCIMYWHGLQIRASKREYLPDWSLISATYFGEAAIKKWYLLPKVRALWFLTLLLTTVNDFVQIRPFSSILPQDSLKKRLLMDLTSYNGLNRVDSVRCKITMLRIVSNLSFVRLQCSESSRFRPL